MMSPTRNCELAKDDERSAMGLCLIRNKQTVQSQAFVSNWKIVIFQLRTINSFTKSVATDLFRRITNSVLKIRVKTAVERWVIQIHQCERIAHHQDLAYPPEFLDHTLRIVLVGHWPRDKRPRSCRMNTLSGTRASDNVRSVSRSCRFRKNKW